MANETGNSKFDFLAPGPAQIRHQIEGIIDSYSHDWDLIAELAQNAVDAIRARGAGVTEKGHIRVTVDASTRTVTIVDNGVGIKSSELPTLLRPFSTSKAGKANQIGSKGVGLAFVIFSSSSFEIDTNAGDGGMKAVVNDAAQWVTSNSDASPAAHTDVCSVAQGTVVKITVADQNHPLFDLTALEVEFVLRTKTALGDTGYIWDLPFDCDVEFLHVSKDGVQTNKDFECRYLLPVDNLKKADTLSLGEFIEWMTGDRSDAEKRRKLKDKIIFHSEWTTKHNRTIRWWSCFIPTRSWWDVLNENTGLPKRTTDVDDDAQTALGFGSGLFTSTKGMPTGITLDLKPKGSAGYVPNFFILVEDPELSFDIGRKSIPGRQQGMLRQIAHDDFRDYINRVQKYIAGEPDRIHGGWDKSTEFSEIRDLLPLTSSLTRFSRRPDSQEATVVAIFFEQIGRGNFPEITPLLSGYKKKYDLYAQYKSADTVIEFKYDLSSLINEFNDAKKMFDQVDVVVVWEVTEADMQLAGRRGLTVEKLEQSSFAKESPSFHYRIDLGPVDPIYVIALRETLGL